MMQMGLAMGERVQFKVMNKEDSINGIITKIDLCGQKGDLLTNSPSSDKENNESNVAVSPRKRPQNRFLHHKYSLDIEGQDKVVHGVPGSDLIRIVKHPSKDMVKLFIRGFATRTQATSPWVVTDERLKKYNKWCQE